MTWKLDGRNIIVPSSSCLEEVEILNSWGDDPKAGLKWVG